MNENKMINQICHSISYVYDALAWLPCHMVVSN